MGVFGRFLFLGDLEIFCIFGVFRRDVYFKFNIWRCRFTSVGVGSTAVRSHSGSDITP